MRTYSFKRGKTKAGRSVGYGQYIVDPEASLEDIKKELGGVIKNAVGYDVLDLRAYFYRDDIGANGWAVWVQWDQEKPRKVAVSTANDLVERRKLQT